MGPLVKYLVFKYVWLSLKYSLKKMSINYLIPMYNGIWTDKNRGNDLFLVSAICILAVNYKTNLTIYEKLQRSLIVYQTHVVFQWVPKKSRKENTVTPFPEDKESLPEAGRLIIILTHVTNRCTRTMYVCGSTPLTQNLVDARRAEQNDGADLASPYTSPRSWDGNPSWVTQWTCNYFRNEVKFLKIDDTSGHKSAYHIWCLMVCHMVCQSNGKRKARTRPHTCIFKFKHLIWNRFLIYF